MSCPWGLDWIDRKGLLTTGSSFPIHYVDGLGCPKNGIGNRGGELEEDGLGSPSVGKHPQTSQTPRRIATYRTSFEYLPTVLIATVPKRVVHPRRLLPILPESHTVDDGHVIQSQAEPKDFVVVSVV